MEHPDITKVLAYEIKKELADRYFGYRKVIEEDKVGLRKKVEDITRRIVQKICFDLVRIYVLLRDEHLIHEFLEISGIHEEIFYDPYLPESPTIRARVFQGVKMRGLTQAGRFKNLVFDCYDELVRHVGEYREIFGELLEDQEVINEQIRMFYQKNDISSIMGFMRSLDTQTTRGVDLRAGVDPLSSQVLEEKMKVEPPLPIEQELPVFPPLVPLSHIKGKLKTIAEHAFLFHPGGFVPDPVVAR
ncbi:MAG: hypothetical protein KKE17_03735 [Proteobacteria bacterium]|nr:hypothetical protein [Pseudomonadota bacterium]MBU1709096.1 hypothetical protein [Pseudomonadota bacterium]